MGLVYNIQRLATVMGYPTKESETGMQELINIQEKDGQLVTTSRNVAEVFHKQHKHVLKNVAKCIKECEKVSGFSEPNFRLAEYLDEQGKSRPEYIMTQKGWTLLVMSFSGEKAAKFKIAYIDKFEEMRTTPVTTQLPTNYISALEALVESEKQKVVVENKLALLMHDKNTKTYTATELSNELNLSSAMELNRMLLLMGIQRKVNGTWTLYATYRDRGLEFIKEDILDSGKKVYNLRWTEKGRLFILELMADKLNEEGE